MSIKRMLKTHKCKKFIKSLEKIYDSRQSWKVKHKQSSILFIIILSMLSGSNKFMEHYYFACKYKNQLSKMIDLRNGIPSHDTMERTMHRIRSSEINDMIIGLSLLKIQKNKPVHVCIDGKFVRATREGKTKTDAIDIVSVYVANEKISLYSLQTRTKESDKNEHPIIKKIIDILYEKAPQIKFIITIDAIAATHQILTKIVSYGWDYIVCIKSHSKQEGGFYRNVLEEFKLNNGLKFYETKCQANGRIENRKYYVINDVSNVVDIEKWSFVKSIGKVDSRVEVKKTGEITTNERYFILSKSFNTKEFGDYQRGHWSIESFHYVLDYSFNEDHMRMKKDSSCLNTNLFRKIVTNIISGLSPDSSNKSVTNFRDSHRLSSPTELLYCILQTL